MVLFETDVFPQRDVPHMVTIRPILRAGERIPDPFTVARQISEQLQGLIVRSVQTHRVWTIPRILDIHGGLNANNIENGNAHTYDELPRLRDITPEVVLGIFTKLQQSNQHLGLFDVEWTFTIPNATFIRGGRAISTPRWARKCHYSDTWEDNGVNCAAYAIVRLFEKFKRSPRQVDRSKKSLIREASAMSDKYGWSGDVSPAELCDWVKDNPTFCLCILPPPRMKGIPIYGKDFKDVKKIIYLFYDPEQEHYAACASKTTLLASLIPMSGMEWCNTCMIAYTIIQGHSECEVPPKALIKRKECECGLFYSGKHVCYHNKCTYCSSFYKKDEPHRCPLFYNDRPDKKNKWMTENPNGEYPALIAYDFESRFENIENHRSDRIQGFETDVNDQFTGSVTSRSSTIQRHEVDLVVARVCFTGEEKVFKGSNPVSDFINWLFAFNDGNAYVYAHNGSGYDTRLIFTEMQRHFHDRVPQPIMRGGKIMRLTIGNLVFGDSLLHLPGSLKGLAEGFKCPTKKGFFPYLWNTLEHIGYVGAIPPLSSFDASGQKTLKGYQELVKWHSEWEGDYELEKEKLAYCKDDVKILAFILEAHHASMMSLHGLTPWIKPTSPGYITECVGIDLTHKFKEHLPEDKDSAEYQVALQDLALNKSWTALTPWEYNTIHPALRGGRTEVKCLYRQLTPEEKKRGCRIAYVDVVSLYPYQQVVHPNFVGTPIVHYWDLKYQPCYKHKTPGCMCGGGDRLTRAKQQIAQWPLRTLMEKTGILVVTLIPNKTLIHPVLNLWNEEMKKCVPTLR